MEHKLKKDENETLTIFKKLFCEFLGTMALTYVGSWALIFKDWDELGSEGVGLAHGVTLLLFSWICMDISGSHFNSAITLGLIIIQKIPWADGMFYIVAQFSGAICAGLFIQSQLTEEVLFKINKLSLMGLPRPENPHFDVAGIWTELFGTFFVVYTYMALLVESNKKRPKGVFPVAIGMIYFIMYITVGDISGGGFNPARALGPAIVIGKMGNTQFMQFFGPLLGGVLAALFYFNIFVDEDDEEELEREKENVDGDEDEIVEYNNVEEAQKTAHELQ